MIVCEHCGEPATWSRLLEDWWCGDCRSSDVVEVDEYADYLTKRTDDENRAD